MLPTEMKSTPVSAISRIVSRVTPPEASSFKGRGGGAVHRDRLSHGREWKIVEHRDVRARGDRLAQFVEALDFDLHRDLACRVERAAATARAIEPAAMM